MPPGRPSISPHRKRLLSNVQELLKTREVEDVTFEEATARCPFIDRDHYTLILRHDAAFLDLHGKVVCLFLKEAYPSWVAEEADRILTPAATRSSLRAALYGGEAPRSGIAGYYDYFGSPLAEKCRKTSFTEEHARGWPQVYPLVDYANHLYRRLAPKAWTAQNLAIPDVVRLHDSVFSTLTVNERFRTARHTDTGDFDAGLGLVSVLRGRYKGLYLGFPDFKICVDLRPRDLLLFNTHFFHCNTELESCSTLPETWSRLSCVFYYRTNLGTAACMKQYKKRGEVSVSDHKGEAPLHGNRNLPEKVFSEVLTPATLLLAWGRLHRSEALPFYVYLDNYLDSYRAAWEFNHPPLPPRASTALQDPESLLDRPHRGQLSGFSERYFTVQSRDLLHEIKALGLPPALEALWREAREAFLRAVAQDWARLCQTHPQRKDFVWSNHGKTNRMFFELCDVAVGLRTYLQEETSPEIQSLFWGALAVHLFQTCIQELHLPPSAMSLRKLNVKLKDYSFGGTRYVHNLSLEAQARRKARQAQIAEAAQRDRLVDQPTEAFRPYNSTRLNPEEFCILRQLNYCPVSRALLLKQAQPQLAYKKKKICFITHEEPTFEVESVLRQMLTMSSTEKGGEPEILSLGTRLLQSYAEQRRTLVPFPTSKEKITSLTIVDLLHVLKAFSSKEGHTPRILTESELFFIPRALRFLPLETLTQVFRGLKPLNKPLLFGTFLGEDPKHFLLKKKLREDYERVFPFLMRTLTGNNVEARPLGSWLSQEWIRWVDQQGWTVLGDYVVTGAALGDTFFGVIPSTASEVL